MPDLRRNINLRMLSEISGVNYNTLKSWMKTWRLYGYQAGHDHPEDTRANIYDLKDIMFVCAVEKLTSIGVSFGTATKILLSWMYEIEYVTFYNMGGGEIVGCENGVTLSIDEDELIDYIRQRTADTQKFSNKPKEKRRKHV